MDDAAIVRIFQAAWNAVDAKAQTKYLPLIRDAQTLKQARGAIAELLALAKVGPGDENQTVQFAQAITADWQKVRDWALLGYSSRSLK